MNTHARSAKYLTIASVGILAAVIGLFPFRGLAPSDAAAQKAMSEKHAGHDHGEPAGHDEKPDDETKYLSHKDDHEEHGHGDHLDDNGTGPADHGAEGRRHDHSQTKPATHRDDHQEHVHGDHGGHDDICPEHRIPETEDALCHGDRLADMHPGEGMKVRLASPEAAAKAGIGTVAPQTVLLSAGIDIPARVEFNRDQLARITPLSAGIVRRVAVRPGARIRRGDLLAEVAMPEIAALKARLLAAEVRQEQTMVVFLREKELLEKGISSRQEFQDAEAMFRTAQNDVEHNRQQLLNYGILPSEIRRFMGEGDRSPVVPLRAPLAGTVVDVQTAAGEAVEPGRPLLTVASLDPLWLEIAVPESRIFQARENALVQARFNGLPGTVFSGRIFQAGALVDERTRTLKVLAEVSNPEHLLKVGMFGNARILEGTEEQALAVPADALQSIDGHSFVFVRREADLFELRRVQAGEKAGDIIPILAGLSPAEEVVSEQGFALKSEVLKARLGASCADH